MALQSLSSGYALVGPRADSNPGGTGSNFLDQTNECMIAIGRVKTADGGSHTIDTTGSSSLQWMSGSTTFANAGTTCKVGLAPVDTANGPPPRASNTTNAINFDVSASFTGGGGGITANAVQTSVPTSGTKTLANGDLVAFAVQTTAIGGADAIQVIFASLSMNIHAPVVTGFLNGAYGGIGPGRPNVIITFSDGTLGWIEGSDILRTRSARTWNSGSATKEYGQLYQLPFPAKVCGIYGWLFASANTDVVLYSDPLGTPVAEKTVSIDFNTYLSTSSPFYFEEYFTSPYTTTANQPIGAVLKPGGSNISAYYKTLGSATHRVADPWGTSGYGISRASGAFANANSSLDHYYIGLILSAFDDGVSAGGKSFSATIF